MKQIKKFFLWAFMLNKRLYKKVSFLLVLCLIPVLVVCMSVFAQEDSGIVRIALCSEDSKDESANKIIAALLEEDQLIHFQVAENVDTAYTWVQNGETDIAWIFHENLQQKIEDYTSGEKKQEPFITIVEREETIFSQLTREKLYGALYPDLSYALYEDYIYDALLTEEEISKEELREYYDAVLGGNQIVVVEQMDVGVVEEESNYLTLPLRGMLSLVILLCGLAAIMYVQKDVALGIYDWLPAKNHIRPAFGTCFAAVVNASVAVLLALLFSGLFTSFGKEISALLMYIAATVAFCMLIGTITRKAEHMGQLIPFLMLIALVLSPIFFSLKSLLALQRFLPTYYYLFALQDSVYIWYGLIYAGVLFALNYGLHRVTHGK